MAPSAGTAGRSGRRGACRAAGGRRTRLGCAARRRGGARRRRRAGAGQPGRAGPGPAARRRPRPGTQVARRDPRPWPARSAAPACGARSSWTCPAVAATGRRAAGRPGRRASCCAVGDYPAGHVAVEAADVTEAHRVARVRRDFVANVSHELKTPVGALQLLAEALLDATDRRRPGPARTSPPPLRRADPARVARGWAGWSTSCWSCPGCRAPSRCPTPEPVAVDWVDRRGGRPHPHRGRGQEHRGRASPAPAG